MKKNAKAKAKAKAAVKEQAKAVTCEDLNGSSDAADTSSSGD